jgi:hypothetical protein
MDAQSRSKMFRSEDSCEEARDGDEVRHDISPVAADHGDAKEDDVAGHGIGEDVTVEEEDDGVEEATCGGEEHGVGERGGLDGVLGRHRDVDEWTVREYLECGLNVV